MRFGRGFTNLPRFGMGMVAGLLSTTDTWVTALAATVFIFSSFTLESSVRIAINSNQISYLMPESVL